jgi:hypothetical protein
MADVDLELIRDLVADDYITAIEREHGHRGIEALKRLTPILDLVHEQLAYEMIDRGLTVLCPLDPKDTLLPDGSATLVVAELAARVQGAAAIQLLPDDRLLVQFEMIDPLSVADRAVVYHFDGRDRFAVGNQMLDVNNPTNYPSLWGVPTFFDLEAALDHYSEALALRCRCPHLQGMWFDPGKRWILQNKPEKIMQLSLHTYLVGALRAHRKVEVRREQPAGGRKPPDIKITWSMTTRLAFIEVKWMGASIHATEHRISWRPDVQEANDGADQLVQYLEQNVSEAPGHQTMGFLVVFDGRRDDVDVDEELTREEAVAFASSDVAYDPDFTYRHDFAAPRRFYMYPLAPPA